MSDNENMNENDVVSEMPTPFELLKQKATLLGIKFHPSIGEATLLAKVQAHLAEPETKAEPTVEVPVVAASTTNDDPAAHIPQCEYVIPETPEEKAQRQRKEANRLVRIVATCMNPNKKAMTGEYFTVANRVIGTIKKFVQFDAPDGWHVPAIIVDHLKSRQCQIFVPGVNNKGKKVMLPKLIKEFSIVELPKLTPADLKALAERQALAGSID